MKGWGIVVLNEAIRDEQMDTEGGKNSNGKGKIWVGFVLEWVSGRVESVQ